MVETFVILTAAVEMTFLMTSFLQIEGVTLTTKECNRIVIDRQRAFCLCIHIKAKTFSKQTKVRNQTFIHRDLLSYLITRAAF